MTRNKDRIRRWARPAACCLLVAWMASTGGVTWGQKIAEASAGEPEKPAASGPRIEIAQREIDLGSLFRGESAEARFEIRNLGDETLRILRAKPG
jgi:hypothetical protein